MSKIQETLQILVVNDPDWKTFRASLPKSLLSEHAHVSEELATKVSDILRAERPELVPFLDNPPTESQKFGLNSKKVLSVAAILFLLQTQILIENQDGAVKFRIEKSAMDNKNLVKVMEGLQELFDGGY